jgi:choline dehydrogenase-like flavoprotein
MPERQYDVAIVGAGFSGPILAAKIAEKGVNPRNGDRLKVALIEAGPYLKGTPRPGYGSPLRRQMITNLEDDQSTYLWDNNRSRAKVVGGSSLHWGAQAFLPYPVDYVHWQRETGVDWTEEKFREAVAEIRRVFNVHRYPDEIDTRGNRLFRDVAKQMGYDPRRHEAARRNCIYCGFCLSPMMCKYDSRSSTLVTYIPLAERNGVEIIPDTYVEKILIEAKGDRGVARGLLCQNQGSSYEIAADKIMVSCGYRGTPLLLMRSGYGPKEWKGNPIIVENPNIGKHIDGHLSSNLGVSALFDEPLGDGELGSIGGYYLIHDERADGEGRLLLRATFGYDQLPSRAALHPFAPLYGREHKRYMREKGILRTGLLSASVSKPSGRWYIDPDGKILCGGDHSLTIRRVEEGRQMAYEVLQKMGARKISSPPAPVRITPTTRGQHSVGSCRAGVDPKTSVVNPYFESHDVDNLFLCDGSVIPRTTTGNTGTPQASVTVFAAGRMIERQFS